MSAQLTLSHVETLLTSGETLRTPWWEVASGVEGPVLLIIAAQHGNEVQGSEVIRRFAPICREALVKGTALLIPFGNLLAMRHRRNSVMLGPEEKQTELHSRVNMNCLWPGDSAGNDIERLIASLDESLVQRATHVVDLHCWNRFWATATLASEGGDSALMADATGTRFVWRSGRSQHSTVRTQIGSLTLARGRSAMVIEFSGQYCVYEREVQVGVRAMCSVAKALGMMDGDPEIPSDSGIEVTRENTTVVEAPCRGLFIEQSGLRLEDRIEAGQRLGHIVRDDDLSVVEITAPATGWLWRFGSHRPDPDVSLADQHPYSDEGDPLAAIVLAG